MSRRQIHVWGVHNLRFEALCVAEPDLPLASFGLDGQAARIDLSVVDELPAKRARTTEHSIRSRIHNLTRIRRINGAYFLHFHNN